MQYEREQERRRLYEQMRDGIIRTMPMPMMLPQRQTWPWEGQSTPLENPATSVSAPKPQPKIEVLERLPRVILLLDD